MDTFHDAILLSTQDIQVVNFSNISRGFVNVIIMYKDVEGRSVKLEALGNIDKDYVQTLDFLWQAMKRAAQEAPSDYSGSFSSLTQSVTSYIYHPGTGPGVSLLFWFFVR